MEEVEKVVIVGAGVSGLATALGLHRQVLPHRFHILNSMKKGIRSLVLESSESLRAAGFAILTWPNAWRALDALGVADSLRRTHIQLQGYSITTPSSSAPPLTHPVQSLPPHVADVPTLSTVVIRPLLPPPLRSPTLPPPVISSPPLPSLTLSAPVSTPPPTISPPPLPALTSSAPALPLPLATSPPLLSVRAPRTPTDPFLPPTVVLPSFLPLLLTTAPPNLPKPLFLPPVFLTVPPLHVNAAVTATRNQALFWQEIKIPDDPTIHVEFELVGKLNVKDGWSVTDPPLVINSATSGVVITEQSFTGEEQWKHEG
ncbi:hypothetical protein KSP40_PGU015623 [Platanthera guangdongensis]|uniref:Uncharacterized protein n=1 Tax=Platanthera guangdongensis TaxID=2320717 RepID=A0ABR2LNR0_9ASPA